MTRRIVATLCFLSVLISGLVLTQSLQIRSSSTGRSPDSGRFQPNSQAIVGEQTVSEPVTPVSTGAVRDLPDDQPSEDMLLEREVNPRINWGFNPFQRYKSGPDPLLDVQASARAAVDASFLSTILNTNGQTYSSVNPPDPSGDVGPNHFVQMINASSGASVTIYDKNLNLIKGPFMLDALGAGNCASGLGDPIVLYDRLADRWLLSEFSNGGNKLCLYVSQTPDPTGAYHNYEFTGANGFPDYPKYGVWPDAYYAGTNESALNTPVPTVYAFDRVNMLAGNPATYQSFNMPRLSGFGFQMLTPSDLDGAT
ncbi:MAG: hypothetical protein ACPG8W_14990, partial [Candidatus Promineifilaceae bacterium]